MENKRLKDRQIMLEQQVKGKIRFHTILCYLKDRCLVIIIMHYIPFFVLELEDSRRILTERMMEAEQETFKIIEENVKLKDENKGS